MSEFAIIDKHILRLAMVKNLYLLSLVLVFASGCVGMKNTRKQALDENIQATLSQLNVIKTIEQKISAKLEEDPNNAVKSYLPILSALRSELNARKTLLQSLDLKKDAEKIEQLAREYRKKRDEEINMLLMMNDFINMGAGTVKSEGTFESGEFTLNPDVKERIQIFIGQVKDSLSKYEGKLDTNQTLQIEITTTGYSDAEPLRRPKLIRLLKSKANGPLPLPKKDINLVENRKFLNKVLSRLRARSVYKHLESALRKAGYTQIIQRKNNVIGLGEQHPYRDVKDYLEVDERRRICKFSVAIIPVKNGGLED